MNRQIIKKTLLGSVVVGTTLFTQHTFAQDGENADTQTASASQATGNPLLSLYDDYSQARFAVQWKVPTGDLSDLRAKMPRYGYLMYYTSPSLLAASRGPYVQFGFFKSRKEAEQFVEDNKAAFLGLRVVNVQPSEHGALKRQIPTNAVNAGEEALGDYYWLSDASAPSRKALNVVLTEAKSLYMNGQYEKALEYYSALSLVSDQNISTWALELKGLSEERLGLYEQAMRTYKTLLAQGTDEAWVTRVNQRLRALETAANDGKDALRKSKYNEDQSPFYYRGVVGQSYNYVTSGGKNIADHDVLSIIATNLDVTAGYRHPEHEFEVRLNGYSNYDLMDYPEDWKWGDDDRTVIKRAQLDYTHVETGVRATGGRQKDYDSGMYMYFDGLSVKYPVNDKITVGVNAGVPVQFSDFYDVLDRQFYSAQASYEHNKYWKIAGYFTHQTLYGEIDRAAWGGRLQYVDDRFSSYLNLDYDYEFAEVNILRWSGTLKVNKQHQVSATYGLQRLPFLTSTNILLGQPYLNVESYLRDQFNRDYLLWNALERTGLYEYGTLSHQFEVDEQLHVTTDIYHSVSSELPIFEYDDEWLTSTVVANDAEFRYSSLGVQAVARDFLGMDDSATLSFRHADTTLASSNQIQISERLRFWNNKVFVTPKLHMKYTQKKENDTSRSNIRGSLTLTYKPWRNVELRVEAGNEAIRYLDEKNSLDQSYLFMGYQARF